jgi:hypothetical protein
VKSKYKEIAHSNVQTPSTTSRTLDPASNSGSCQSVSRAPSANIRSVRILAQLWPRKIRNVRSAGRPRLQEAMTGKNQLGMMTAGGEDLIIQGQANSPSTREITSKATALVTWTGRAGAGAVTT